MKPKTPFLRKRAGFCGFYMHISIAGQRIKHLLEIVTSWNLQMVASYNPLYQPERGI
jgi:coproporphyrinogen III oxidase-like Fe-S oxidoreductase